MAGTLAQVDAGLLLQGGEYTLAGGFWRVGGPVVYGVYLPAVLKE